MCLTSYLRIFFHAGSLASLTADATKRLRPPTCPNTAVTPGTRGIVLESLSVITSTSAYGAERASGYPMRA